MVALSEHKIEIVRALVEAAPDRVVGRLKMALAETGEDTALASVRRLVDTEANDRLVRNTVLQPVAPMCVGDGKDPRALTFPARALACVWRGLRVRAPEEVGEAALALADLNPEDEPPQIFDDLAQLAAAGLRAGAPREFRTAAELCDAARPRGAEVFAACLDLAPVVRRATARLPEWVAHTGDDTTASARLAYKDAVAIADDAGTRFFEMLAAQLTHPWMVLRIISAVMDKPTERYLADSELAGFGERVMAQIDDALGAIANLDVDGGPEAARAAGRRAELITELTSELEGFIDLSREHGWGHRIVNQKKALASVVEGRLRDAEKLTAAALPTQPAKLARLRKSVPRLTAPPDPDAVRRALTLLTFAQEIRTSANYGGFASARAKLLENLGGMLDHYVEELIDHVKTGDVDNVDIAYGFLIVASEVSRLVRDDKAADLVRRRAAAACHGESADAEAG